MDKVDNGAILVREAVSMEIFGGLEPMIEKLRLRVGTQIWPNLAPSGSFPLRCWAEALRISLV